MQEMMEQFMKTDEVRERQNLAQKLKHGNRNSVKETKTSHLYVS